MRHRISAVGGLPGGLIAGGVVVSRLMLASAAAEAETRNRITTLLAVVAART